MLPIYLPAKYAQLASNTIVPPEWIKSASTQSDRACWGRNSCWAMRQTPKLQIKNKKKERENEKRSAISLSLSLPLALSNRPPCFVFQVPRITAAFLHLAALMFAHAQTAWCDAATEGCTRCPRAFPRTPRNCESGAHPPAKQTHFKYLDQWISYNQ